MPNPILKVAAKAVIVNAAGQVLLLRESPIDTNSQPGLWGTSGGKLEPGESFFEALHREIMEETGLAAEAIKPLYVSEWRPVVRGVQLHIVATFILCRTATANGDVRLSPEHDDYMWINPADYQKYPLMQPDNIVMERLIEELKLTT
jgi:8-oxo-dGTP diphosphatase